MTASSACSRGISFLLSRNRLQRRGQSRLVCRGYSALGAVDSVSATPDGLVDLGHSLADVDQLTAKRTPSTAA